MGESISYGLETRHKPGFLDPRTLNIPELLNFARYWATELIHTSPDRPEYSRAGNRLDAALTELGKRDSG